MNFKNLKIVIMAGGRGERLWPKSTYSVPKQFCSISTEHPMVKDTYDRFIQFIPKENIYISINKDYEKLLKKAIPFISAKQIIIEPQARDTAASILLSLLATPSNAEDVFLFAPSDHYIKKIAPFKKDIAKSYKLTDKSSNMTLFGINPTYPAEGFGYIKTKNLTNSKAQNKSHYTVMKFVEKPTEKVAKKYIATKHYFWNSGLFMFKKDHLLSLFKTHMLEDYHKIERYLKTIKKANKKFQLTKEFQTITKISFDYAIVEKLKNINCIKASFDWDDVGNWESLFRIRKTDKNNNILNGNISAFETLNTICQSEEEKQIILNGLKDFIVINTKDKLYIAHTSQSNKIKSIVKKISL